MMDLMDDIMANPVLDMFIQKEGSSEKLLVISIFKQALDDAMMYRRPRYLPGLIENAKKKRFDQSVFTLFSYFVMLQISKKHFYYWRNLNFLYGLDVIKEITYKRQQREKFRLKKNNSKFKKKWNHYYRRRQLEEIAYDAREWISTECSVFKYYCNLLDVDAVYAQDKMHSLIEQFDRGVYQPRVNYIF